MGSILINCDLGENESDEQTERMLAKVDAANICCGVHAGNDAKTRKTLQQAAQAGVVIGAHPGLAHDGGRGSELPDPKDFRVLLEEQLTRFIRYADGFETWVSYVKLHGSLYHAVELDADLAEIYIDCLQHVGCGFSVFARAGGAFQERARAAGLLVHEEIFADRGYRRDGSLVPRSSEGALLDVEAALARFLKWKRSGLMDTVDGEPIKLGADTICIHSDSPGSETLLAGLKNLISF